MRGRFVLLQHPVQRRHMWLMLGLTLLVWIGAAIWAARQVVQQGVATIALSTLPLSLSLPAGLKAHADIASDVHSHLNVRAQVVVPIDQTMHVGLAQTIVTQVALETEVPITTSVRFKGDIPVDTLVALDVPVVSWLPRFQVVVPVKVVVPVDITVPVNTRVPLHLNMPVEARLVSAPPLPIKARLPVEVRVESPVVGRVVNRAGFTVVGPMSALPVGLRAVDIKVPLERLAVGR